VGDSGAQACVIGADAGARVLSRRSLQKQAEAQFLGLMREEEGCSQFKRSSIKFISNPTDCQNNMTKVFLI
jgi:hypothetical protein